MLCPECRFDNRDGAKFCGQCGHTFRSACPQCGAGNPIGHKFCDECGSFLGRAENRFSLDYDKPHTYTPKYLAEKILTTRNAIEGERKVVTVLFADVVNFTAIAEKLDPEDVHQIMDTCFGILMDRVHQYEGTINQFTGDGIMALFGAPLSHENHAQRACYAALSIRNAIEDFGKKISADYGLSFKMRFGINSGLVMVGSIGDDLRMDYTAVGDTSILAKRMESTAKPGSVLMSENTHRLVTAYFETAPVGPVRLKGKAEAQNAYVLMGISKVQTRFDASVSRGLVKFVGRKNSLGTLGDTWSRAAGGAGRALGISGEPGVGKSRLLVEFVHSISGVDFRFFQGKCLHHGSSTAYLPITEMLKSYFAITEGLSEFDIQKKITGKIARLFKDEASDIQSAVQHVLSVPVDDAAWHQMEPKQRREKIFGGLRRLLIRLSEEKPLIIVIDDLQWVDGSSEAFFGTFSDAISRHPILLVFLYRTEYTHFSKNQPHYLELRLGLLTEKSSTELISAIFEGNTVSAELERLILKKTAGNPLFIEEFIYMLLENDCIEKKKDCMILNRRFDAGRIPDTVQGIVAERLDLLDGELKSVLQVASVIGREFRYPILQMVTGRGDTLKQILNDLQRLEFIYEKELFPEMAYTFKHSLFQEVAYSSLLLSQRRALHRQIGSAIVSIYDQRLDEFYEILAYHYSWGEDYEKAYPYAKLSGKKAAANYSHAEAFGFFKKALELFDRLPQKKKSGREKIELYNLMRRPIAMLGHPKGSLEILESGVKIAKKARDLKSLSRYYNDISILHTVRGNSALSIENSERSFKEAEKIEDIDIMAQASLSLCYAYTTSSSYKKLIDITSKVAGVIEKTGRTADFFNTPFNLYSFCLGLCGMAMGMLGDFQKGKSVTEKALRHAADAGHAMTLAFNEFQCANLLVLKGDGEAAVDHCRNSIKQAEDTEWPTILSQAWTVLGYANYLLGKLENAREYVEKGLEIQKESGIEAMLSMHYCILAMILFGSDDAADALQCSETALALSVKNHEKRYEGISRIWIGRIMGSKSRGQYAEGARFILDGQKIVKNLGLKPAVAQGHFHLGELYTNSGEHQNARLHLETAGAMFEEMDMNFWLAKSRRALGALLT